MADIVIQASSNAYRRVGNTYQTRQYLALGSGYTDIVVDALQSAQPSASLRTAEQAQLLALLGQSSEVIPGGLTLYAIHALTSALFDGETFALNLIARDPESTDYQVGTQAAYEEQFDYARSVAQSTPTNVRGGTARMGFELAELGTQMSLNRYRELQARYDKVIEQNLAATQLVQQVKHQIRVAQLQAQQQQAATEQGKVMQTLAASEACSRLRNDCIRSAAGVAEFVGQPQMWTQENLTGEGVGQGATATTFGSTIFR